VLVLVRAPLEDGPAALRAADGAGRGVRRDADPAEEEHLDLGVQPRLVLGPRRELDPPLPGADVFDRRRQELDAT
jgi:hypothetical protein